MNALFDAVVLTVLGGHLMAGSVVLRIDDDTDIWPYSIGDNRAVFESADLGAGRHQLQLIRTDSDMRSERVDIYVFEP